MDFYGTMIISPINRPPFEILADWEYSEKYECWYGDGRSFSKEICKIKEGDADGLPVHQGE